MEPRTGSGRDRVNSVVEAAVARRRVAFRGYSYRGKWVRAGNSWEDRWVLLDKKQPMWLIFSI